MVCEGPVPLLMIRKALPHILQIPLIFLQVLYKTNERHLYSSSTPSMTDAIEASEAHKSNQGAFISGSWIIDDGSTQSGSKASTTGHHHHSVAVAQRALFGMNKRRTGGRKNGTRDARTPSRLSRVSVADEDSN